MIHFLIYGATLSVESKTAENGMVLRVPVNLTANVGELVSAMQFEVSYDSEFYKIINVVIGSASTSAQKTLQYNNISNNTVRVIIAGLNQNVISNGCVAELECKVCVSTWQGSANVILSGVILSNPSGNRVPSQTMNGTISIVRTPHHTADIDKDWRISLSEVLRVIQFYNYGSFSCGCTTEDGYELTSGIRTCYPHRSDYYPTPDWRISLYELLRLIQLYNFGSYRVQNGTEDGYGLGSR